MQLSSRAGEEAGITWLGLAAESVPWYHSSENSRASAESAHFPSPKPRFFIPNSTPFVGCSGSTSVYGLYASGSDIVLGIGLEAGGWKRGGNGERWSGRSRLNEK